MNLESKTKQYNKERKKKKKDHQGTKPLNINWQRCAHLKAKTYLVSLHKIAANKGLRTIQPLILEVSPCIISKDKL